MRALTRTVLAGALVTAGFLTSPASAENCFGEQNTVLVCVTAPDVVIGEEQYCFYVGGDTCKPVDVPTATLEGQLDVDCERPSACRAIHLGICDMTTIFTCKTR